MFLISSSIIAASDESSFPQSLDHDKIGKPSTRFLHLADIDPINNPRFFHPSSEFPLVVHRDGGRFTRISRIRSPFLAREEASTKQNSSVWPSCLSILRTLHDSQKLVSDCSSKILLLIVHFFLESSPWILSILDITHRFLAWFSFLIFSTCIECGLLFHSIVWEKLTFLQQLSNKYYYETLSWKNLLKHFIHSQNRGMFASLDCLFPFYDLPLPRSIHRLRSVPSTYLTSCQIGVVSPPPSPPPPFPPPSLPPSLCLPHPRTRLRTNTLQNIEISWAKKPKTSRLLLS